MPGSGWIDDQILGEQYWRIGPYLTEDVSLEELAPGVVLPFVHRPLSRYVNQLAAGRAARRAHGRARTAARVHRPGPRVRRVRHDPETAGATDGEVRLLRLRRASQGADTRRMRRLARALVPLGIIGVVLGLSKLHAVRHHYDFTGSFRFGWAILYIVLLWGCAYAARDP